MKKFYLMLVSLFCVAFSAQAQEVTDLAQLSNDAVYTLKSERAFLFYKDGKLYTSTGKEAGTVTENNADVNQLFRIEKNGANYYLFSVGAKKYIDATGAAVDNASAVLTLTKVEGSYPWKLVLGGKGMRLITMVIIMSLVFLLVYVLVPRIGAMFDLATSAPSQESVPGIEGSSEFDLNAPFIIVPNDYVEGEELIIED